MIRLEEEAEGVAVVTLDRPARRSADLQEGKAAFADRRPPRFTGR